MLDCRFGGGLERQMISISLLEETVELNIIGKVIWDED